MFGRSLISALVLLLLALLGPPAQAKDVPVPSSCSPQVNAKLQSVIDEHSRDVDNVMGCGIAVGTSYRSGGPHGPHHIITLDVMLPQDGKARIQIAINDDLDGAISAKAGDQVFAYGQGYSTTGRWKAGIHDVHCSTHRSADNGWVVVNGAKTPQSCGR